MSWIFTEYKLGTNTLPDRGSRQNSDLVEAKFLWKRPIVDKVNK